ncbi:MAG: helix-turn-helix domain-containing protein [Thermodesulfobacteriota bacterium]|jgi:transcriptional regulator with XRE-family HTH domain
MNKHWTERSIKDYLFRIASDFLTQLEKKMEASGTSQDELAEELGLTKGRVSQVLNHPGNITLSNVIKYTRALGMKVSIVAYEDNDPENIKGPINSEVFKICWEKLGKPPDFWAFNEISTGENLPHGLLYSDPFINPSLGVIPGTGQIPDGYPEDFLKDYKLIPGANAQGSSQSTPAGASRMHVILPSL